MAAKTSLTALALLISVGSGGALAGDSTYTKHDYPKCTFVKREDDGDIRRCKGHAGIQVNWYGGEDGTSVDFGKDGLVGDGVGLSFANPSNMVEWHGPLVKGKVKPDAAIVRYSICQNIGGDNCHSTLYVFRLDGAASSCIMSAIDGAKKDANLVARLMVDQKAAGFTCGKDARIEP